MPFSRMQHSDFSEWHIPFNSELSTPVWEDFLKLAILFLFGVVLKSMQNRAKRYKNEG